jgi:hypothetical protein
VPESTDIAADLLALMGSPDIASRRWIWEQYDHMVGADTVQRPGGDAAVVRVHGTDKGLAITTDCTPRYCFADPVEGGKQAIAEPGATSPRSARPRSRSTNCLNFANPQRPEIMGQFVGCLEGMAEACTALDFPIVSGNVSLYNESKATGGGSAILPTPAIGGVGLLKDWSKSCTIGFKGVGDIIIAIGERGGPSRPVDLAARSPWPRGRPAAAGRPAAERRTGDFIRSRSRPAAITACHDVSDGGSRSRSPRWRSPRTSARSSSEPQPFGVAGSLVRRGPGPLRRHGVRRPASPTSWSPPTRPACRRSDRPHDRRPADLRARGRRFLRVAPRPTKAAHEGFFPALMGEDAALAIYSGLKPMIRKAAH